VGDKRLAKSGAVFGKVKDLAVEETLLSWDEICHVAGHFGSVNTLFAGTNQLTALSKVPSSSPLTSNLVSLSLEYNDFTSLADIASLSSLAALRNLHLKGNNISAISDVSSSPIPSFPRTLQYVDISYNRVDSWSFIDALPSIFPGLTSFRFSHNPLYDNPAFDGAPSTASTSEAKTTVTEEAYMVTLARLPGLTSLNFSTITAEDRTNAETFYLSRIARQLAQVPEGAEESVTSQHGRFDELCELYGEPTVVRTSEINPAFLEARLVHVTFYLQGNGLEREVKVPKSFDMYAVKGLAGKLFGLPPLQLKMVWETGEWDPVASYDDDDDVESSEGEEEQQSLEKKMGTGTDERQEGKAGRWVRRQVELKDCPRQFGFCVDGFEARIRVEVKTN
jgi:tubulin-specific chaperone E